MAMFRPDSTESGAPALERPVGGAVCFEFVPLAERKMIKRVPTLFTRGGRYVEQSRLADTEE